MAGFTNSDVTRDHDSTAALDVSRQGRRGFLRTLALAGLATGLAVLAGSQEALAKGAGGKGKGGKGKGGKKGAGKSAGKGKGKKPKANA